MAKLTAGRPNLHWLCRQAFKSPEQSPAGRDLPGDCEEERGREVGGDGGRQSCASFRGSKGTDHSGEGGVQCAGHALPEPCCVPCTVSRAPGVHKSLQVARHPWSWSWQPVPHQGEPLPSSLLTPGSVNLNVQVDFPSKAEVLCRLPSGKLFPPGSEGGARRKTGLPQNNTSVETSGCLTWERYRTTTT